MTFDFTEDSTVKFIMIDYIDEIIAAFDKAYPRDRGINTSAAPENLYNVDKDCEKLSRANTLYTTKWSSPYACTAVVFLTTIVREPNKYDCGNLVHLMKYIRGTRDLRLILSSNDSGVLNWWVGVYYAVHPNMWVHKGEELSIGIVFPIVTSTNQKLNTCTSTESYIVGVQYCMPDILWTR